ncbi:MAG: PAS domain-containing protein [Elusimicrobia bacterium]|nr:PAS domain-containing protein [Elusimicrobiota bacterium]
MTSRKSHAKNVGPLKQAETIIEIASRFGPLIEALPDVVYVKDLSLRNLAVNARYERLVKRSRDAILGHTDEDLLPPTLAASCRAADLSVLKSGLAQRYEQVGDDGTVFDTVKAPLLGEDGTAIGLIGVSRDVTDYKRVESALRRAEERLGRVVSEAPVVLFQIDRRGVITLSEGRGLAALGLKPGQAVGASVFEMYAHNPAILESVRRALAGEAFSVVTKEAGLWFEIHYQPQRGAGGKVESLLGVATDVTARVESEVEVQRLLAVEKDLRDEAEKASRAKDDFLALLSHELRTPMTAMMGWTYLLRQKEVGSPEFNQALEIIERNMHLQAQIIEDLLDVSKIFTGRMRVEQRSLDLSAIVRAAIDVVRPVAQAHGVSLDLGPLSSIMVVGDPERLQQVAWNLLSNALKFTPDAGKVLVRLKRSRDTVELTITDSGIGILAEYLPHVFDPFSQAERALTREHRGLGLGLAIVRHIVELHGGSVKAESAGTGCGSTFSVRLPIMAEARAQAPAPGALPPGGLEILYASLPRLDGVRVLLVEDEPHLRKMLEASLKGLGADVEAAASAAAALAAMDKRVPDVLISDLGMPGTDGYALIRKVRARPADQGGEVPAAALTTQTRVEDRTQVLMAGFQMYLPKPVEPAELAAAVRSLARRK